VVVLVELICMIATRCDVHSPVPLQAAFAQSFSNKPNEAGASFAFTANGFGRGLAKGSHSRCGLLLMFGRYCIAMLLWWLCTVPMWVHVGGGGAKVEKWGVAEVKS
jgi:hypothetical protein